MTISNRTRKTLWSRAAGRCSFPDCGIELTEDGGTEGPDSIIGEEAHIRARNNGGPRFDESLTSLEIDANSNLILLCRNHHKLVDDQPARFSVKWLSECKRAHEFRIRSLLAVEIGRPDIASIDVEELEKYESTFGGMVVANGWRIGGVTILALQYGSDPVPIGDDWWRGSGLQFVRIDTTGHQTVIFNSSEARPDFDYKVSTTGLSVVDYTYDPTEDDIVRFSRKDFALVSGEIGKSVTLLFSPKELGQSPIEIWQEIDAGLRQLSEAAVYEIRNAGLADPSAAIAQFRDRLSAHQLDGAVAETALSCVDELEEIVAYR